MNALYKSDFPKVKWLVIQNSGTEEEAADIFQEAMMLIFQKCREGKLSLTSSISTYLYGVARMKWMNALKRNGKTARLKEAEENDPPADNILPDDDINDQKKRLFAKYFSKLGEKCQQSLQLYFEGMKGEEIAAQLGYSSYEYYRVAKNRCIETLKKMIRDDEVYKEIKS